MGRLGCLHSQKKQILLYVKNRNKKKVLFVNNEIYKKC